MPNKIYLPSPKDDHGVYVSWNKRQKTIEINGWFDSFIDIEGGVLSLKEFFDRMGITKKDCDDAFEK